MREALPFGADPIEGQQFETTEIHWIKLTSTTASGGFYPAKRYDVNAESQLFTDPDDDCWAWFPNGDTTQTDIFYPMRLVGIKSTDGKAIYAYFSRTSQSCRFSGIRAVVATPYTQGGSV